MPEANPRAFGRYTLTSCIANKPTTVHIKQLVVVRTVKGKGIDLADLVSITSLITDRGLANIMMQMVTPMLPINVSEYDPNGFITASEDIPAMTAATICACCRTDPGRVGVETSKSI